MAGVEDRPDERLQVMKCTRPYPIGSVQQAETRERPHNKSLLYMKSASADFATHIWN